MTEEKRTYLWLVIALICFIALIVGVYNAYKSPSGIKARMDADIRELTNKEQSDYRTLDGTPTELSFDDDRILIVNTWASWSPYSEIEFSKLEAIADAYKDKVHIVALNRMEPKETAGAYLATLRPFAGIEFMLDGNDFFYKHVGGYAMPETIVFDHIGNNYFQKKGVLDQDELSTVIGRLLEQ